MDNDLEVVMVGIVSKDMTMTILLFLQAIDDISIPGRNNILNSSQSILNFSLKMTCLYIEEINCCKGDSNDNRCFVIPIPPRDRFTPQ